MATGPTIQEFFKQFPDDDACLDYLMQLRHGDKRDCPKCGKHGKFHRVRRHPAYECAWCGFEIFPMVGTIFHRSHTPLQKWFYAMYLFTTTRHGVSAKELQRQLGVSYPTAFRMAHLIREYMGKLDGSSPLGGTGRAVEIDETLVGGSVKGKGSGYAGNKTCVVGILERDGKVMTKVVGKRTKIAMKGLILDNVLPGTTVNTDEFGGYKDIGHSGYRHVRVNHNLNEYARKDGAGVNGIENYWSQLKRSIKGTHVHVSGKHLGKYLGEFEFRYNLRKAPALMFPRLISSL